MISVHGRASGEDVEQCPRHCRAEDDELESDIDGYEF